MRKCSTCGNLYSGDLCPTCVAGFAQKPSEPAAPAEDLPLQPGQMFHGMEILELLGRGGMGVVYKARQPALDRIVALKILPQKLALDPDFQNRFIREAKALGALSHPNIVMIHDFGAEGGLFYFIMEFVDGVNLRQILREKTLTPEKAIRVVPQLCDALQYAHVEGVIHRDIKPENILVDKKGRIKITDFGLAKLVGADAPAMLTQTNMVMGTPHYMAPEQIENPKSVDHRADIYSLGVVFYEMLTGELPIGRFEVPSKKVQVDVRLDDVVLKTLEKQPERRYQQVSEFKTAVTNVASAASEEAYQPTVITPKPEDKGLRKAPAMRGVLVVAILAILIAVVAVIVSTSGSPDAAGPVIATANALFDKDDYDAAKALYEHALTLNPAVDQKTLITDRLKACEEALAAGPIDLSPVFFTSQERPNQLRYWKTNELLVRNPFLAKGPEEIDKIVKIMNDNGLVNAARVDIKQAYFSLWGYRDACGMLALETPIAKRLEEEFRAQSNMSHRWSYRKGEFLVLAYSYTRNMRPYFAALVNSIQKKLGLPEEPPVLPLGNLKFPETYSSYGLMLKEERKPAQVPGEKESYHITFSPKDKQENVIEYDAFVFETPARAEEHEKTLRRDTSSRKGIWRVGPTLAVLTLTSREIYGFQRLASQVRQWMGLPEYAFERFVPEPPELPEGFSISSIETDPGKVLEETKLDEFPVKEIARAWRGTLRPAGAVTVLEITNYQFRSRLETPLRQRKAAYYYRDTWFFVADGPDEDTLFALEDLMRAKFMLSPKRRYAELHHARLLQGDLPEGFTLDLETSSRSQLTGKLIGPEVSLSYFAKDTHDFGKVITERRALDDKPGDVVLVKDCVYVHVAGPEKTWPVLDKIETALRKKMRMGPAALGDYVIPGWKLPKEKRFSDRKDIGYSPNPLMGTQAVKQMGFADGSIFVGAWIGFVEPKEAEVMMVQLADPAGAEAVSATLKAKLAGAPNSAIYVKGPFVAAIRQVHPTDDSTFRMLSECVRGKFRARKR